MASLPDTRVLVKLRTTTRLGAAASRANLRPLFEDDRTDASAFGATGGARWHVADLPEPAATPWDLAHARVADQLGIAPSDIVFAEPDLVHGVYVDRDPTAPPPDGPFAAAPDCSAQEQNDDGGQARGPHGQGWHLDDEFSQLASARDAVRFTERRTLIAHLDTGYSSRQEVRPAHMRTEWEMNFVEGDADSRSAEDPDNKRFLLDNSGHGTGTLSVLAGGPVPAWNGKVLGGAPDADVLSLRVADSVVLLRTSAFASALRYAILRGCDVVTMSMGGLPSDLWRETVDWAYEAGVCVASAAGNNFKGLPTKKIVYPARYGRVIAVCGVMADGRPYDDLDLKGIKPVMQGNYGPDSKMGAAMAAYTPNIPWAVYGCEKTVRLNGGGTSSATPQVAAAAALWYEKNKHVLPRDWRRVEAVRHALFSTADKGNGEKLGQGILKAHDALGVPYMEGLPKTKSDNDSWALLRVLTGLGIDAASARERMFNLELAQQWVVNRELQDLVPDPEAAGPGFGDRREVLGKVMEVVIEDPRTSGSLRAHLEDRYRVLLGRGRPKRSEGGAAAEGSAACEKLPTLRAPSTRRLRVYSGDPSLSGQLSSVSANEVTIEIPWEEEMKPGPVGEYVAVDDVDAATGDRYDPVDLNHPHLLARDGWSPSAGNAQFHQQMVYAVAMKTIGHFERALGRPVLWRPGVDSIGRFDERQFVQRLTVRPHGLEGANAFYSPGDVSLQFGYFDADTDSPDLQVPGSRVYTCLSHDIVAHETTHAVLDGMHRLFTEPTNPDVLAFHEAFADIVALMQHFTIREVLEAEIGRTRGDLESESRLGSLAVQFGHSLGKRNALRNAIGRFEHGAWRRNEPDPAALERTLAPHARGAILVSAVFDAFLAIYRNRTADLLRIYTDGSGKLPEGAIHPDLVGRLASEAAKSAGHVLTMCIRALDYLPPVDVTFFEFLRALITADYDLVQDDPYHYRVAFVEAFRRRGIHHLDGSRKDWEGPRTLSVETLRWQGLDQSTVSDTLTEEMRERYEAIAKGLRAYADRCTWFESREMLFHETRKERKELEETLRQAFDDLPGFAKELGIDPTRTFKVHSLRTALRSSPAGRVSPQVIIGLTQEVAVAATDDTPRHDFRGGSTLVVDLSIPTVRYRILKRIGSEDRRKRTGDFLRRIASDPLQAALHGMDGGERFAALHGLADGG
ncbi:MAG: S8 family serine peptidase [Longimicrobiales bacterium]